MVRKDTGWISSEASRRAKSAVAVLLSVAILVGAAGFVAWKGYSLYMDWKQQDDYIGEGEDPVQVLIPDGASLGQIADLCVAADVVRSAAVFEDAAMALPDGKGMTIQPGKYNMLTHLPAATAVDRLLDPRNRVQTKITIREGLRWTAMESIFTDSGVTEEDFTAAFDAIQADPASFGLNAAAGNNPEGFLFPDTYYTLEPVDVTVVLKQMASQFNTVAADLDLENRAAALGLTTQQVVTVASIIEAEVNRAEDRPKVARAIYNRLAIGMLLQLDTTVNYGLGRTGHANLGPGDSTTDTPYNTYMHAGLPPTPIDNPGRTALEAALNPADGDWLYWVAVNLSTGETKFAETYEGHLDNVREYQQWCRGNPDICQ